MNKKNIVAATFVAAVLFSGAAAASPEGDILSLVEYLLSLVNPYEHTT